MLAGGAAPAAAVADSIEVAIYDTSAYEARQIGADGTCGRMRVEAGYDVTWDSLEYETATVTATVKVRRDETGRVVGKFTTTNTVEGYEYAYGDLGRTVDVCKPGRYTVEFKVTVVDDYTGLTDTDTAAASARMTQRVPKKRSNLSIQTRRINNDPWVMTAVGDLTVADAAPRMDRDQKVRVIVWYRGEWYTVDTARTNRRGKVGWRFKPNPYTWSMVYDGTSRVRPDYRTPNFRVPGGTFRMATMSEGLPDFAALVD